MFISMGKAEEIRLIRRIEYEGRNYKQCALQALDLAEVARKLELGWGEEPGTFNAQTLAPRLHILGTELAEGFFANGVVLVEGRSDKAALTAIGRLMGINFGAAGIAILPAEGKGNLDGPLVIFRELGIPTFVLWDYDMDKRPKIENPRWTWPYLNWLTLKLSSVLRRKTIMSVSATRISPKRLNVR